MNQSSARRKKINSSNWRRAMTVFELTVVLLIGLVLVALGWISTRPAVTQTKISKVQEDHRTLARAISNYQIDHSARPPTLASLMVRENYLITLPTDPFQRGGGGYVYVPALSPELPALLISAGPDGDFDLPPELLRIADISLANPALFPSHLRPIMAAASPETAMPSASHEASRVTSDAAMALISAYLYLGTYSAERGIDGDVITVVH